MKVLKNSYWVVQAAKHKKLDLNHYLAVLGLLYNSNIYISHYIIL